MKKRLTAIKVAYWKITWAERFKVIYPDGAISTLMPYRQAQDYMDIFGGEIIVRHGKI